MTEHAVITGTFADFKIIKTRSTAQLIVELPIENADIALRALGGVPQSGKEVSVAVARLNVQEPRPEPKAARGSLAQQAAIQCNDAVFRKFIEERFSTEARTNIEAAAAVREICCVESRAEFDSDPAASQRWHEMNGSFAAWKRL